MIERESKGRKVFFVSGSVDGEEREEIRKIVFIVFSFLVVNNI